jgi:hypothetical protein
MAAADGGQQERRAPGEDQDEGRREGEPAVPEGVRKRGRHDQDREHHRDQREPDRPRAQLEVVGDPGGVDRRAPDRQQQEQRLRRATQRQMAQQVVRELRDGEDVDQVEEELDRPDLGRALAPLLEAADLCPSDRDGRMLRARAGAAI